MLCLFKDIQVGDSVWTYNTETGQKELSAVSNIFARKSENFVKLHFGNDSVACTPEHPFFVNNTWREAKSLRIGDSVLAYTGQKIRIDSVNQFVSDSSVAVYNIETSPNHNYFVSASKLLVHNTCKAGFTSFIKKLADGSAKMIEAKIPNGYTRVNGVFSEGAEVFYNGKNYISPDVYMHNGGVWKMAKKPSLLKSRGKRMGTYDSYLNRIGD